MKRKILWCWLSLLLVAVLVLVCCGPKEEVVKEGELYGGTLTVWPWSSTTAQDASSADVCDGNWNSNVWVAPHIELLLTADFEKYGPRGTGEFPFQLVQSVPDQYMKGQLCESWEVSSDEIVFRIRKGVKWTGREGIMEPREYTAHDAAYNLNRLFTSKTVGGAATFPFIESITATDKWTVVVKTNRFEAAWASLIGFGNYCGHYPREVVEAGVSHLWESSVGTGPFIVREYVEGSSMTWDRNPDYWGTTTINGKEYEIPFVDTLVYPIIPDLATRIAALRTGKLDFAFRTPLQYDETLASTSPDLKAVKCARSGLDYLMLNCSDSEYFHNRDIRRAMMIGTDLEAMRDAIYPGAEIIHAFPIAIDLGPALYTPMEDLPASARELFDYDPVQAKQMLADAGYPEGFEVEILVMSGKYAEIGEMLKAQWSKFGVEVNMKMLESAAFKSEGAVGKTYKDIVIGGMTSANAPMVLGWLYMPEAFQNIAKYTNPDLTARLEKALGTTDVTQRNALLKQLGVEFLEEVAYIPFCDYGMRIHYWPWVKNYYEEAECGISNSGPLLARIWIDQNLKAEMGFK